MRIFFFPILLLLLTYSFAIDNIKFKYLTKNDGLTQNIAIDIAEDRDGFIWIATRNGLNRYDGFDIKQYYNNPKDSTSIPENSIMELTTDNDGNLWIFSNLYFTRYNSSTDNFTRFKVPRDKESVKFVPISQLYQISTHSIKRELFQDFDYFMSTLNLNTGKFESYGLLTPDKKRVRIELYYIDKGQNLWVVPRDGDDQNLYRYDSRSDSVDKFDFSHRPPSLVGALDGGDRFLMTSWNDGIWEVDKISGVIKPLYSELKDCSTHDILYDDHGNIWFTNMGKGLGVIGKDGSLSSVSYKDGVKNSLSSNTVTNLLKDSSGVLWVTSTSSGVSFFDAKSYRCEHFRKDETLKSTLSNNSIYALLEDSGGDIWIGTNYGGLNRYNRESKQFYYYNSTSGKLRLSGKNNTVISLLEDSKGDIWIGNWFGKLQKIDRVKGTITTFDGVSAQNCEENVARDIYEDLLGNLWIVGENIGVTVYDRESEKFKEIRVVGGDKIISKIGFCYSVEGDSRGDIYVGGEHGLLRVDSKTHKVKIYKNLSFKNLFIWDLYFDKSSNSLWVGSNDYGLQRFDLESESFNTPPFLNNFSLKTVYGVIKKGKYLWLSSSEGLKRVDLDKESVDTFLSSHGLQGNEFNQGAFGELIGDEVMFGGHNGFNIIDTKKLKKDEVAPKIVVTDLKIGGNYVPPNGLSSFTTPYKSNSFFVTFSALDFTNEDGLDFKYKLENFDEDWISVDEKERYARYTNLDAGRYIFRVIGSNSDGVWNEEGVSFELIVEKPYWEEWWFRALLISLLIFIIVKITQYRIGVIAERNRVLKERIREKTKEISFQKDKLNAIVNSPIGGIIIFDSYDSIIFKNYYFEQLIERFDSGGNQIKLVNLLDDKSRDSYHQNMDLLRNGEISSFIIQFKLNLENDSRWFNMSVTRFKDSGVDNQFVAALADIDELKLAEQKVIKLEKSNAALAMAVTANHEINQPLMIIQGNIDLMLLNQKEPLSVSAKERVKTIERSIERITSILDRYKNMDEISFTEYLPNTEMVDTER